MADTTICPRCAYQTVEKLFSSPVPDVWDVLQCQQCLYMWRTSEPTRRTQRNAYPEAFMVTVEDIKNAREVPAVPPLRAAARCHAVPSPGARGQRTTRSTGAC